MSFRRRVVIFSAAAVTIAIVIASVVIYLLVRAELRNRIDEDLVHDATVTFDLPILRRGALPPLEIGGAASGPGGQQPQSGDRDEGSSGGPDRERLILPTGPLGGASVYAQLVEADGTVISPSPGEARIPETAEALAVAAGEREPYFRDADLGGADVRIYTAPVEGGGAIEVARSLDEVEHALGRLGLILAAVSLGGVALGAGLGTLVSRAALAPVARLSRAAREVAETRDLSRRIDPRGGSELGALARSFNTMLKALEGSLDSQRQLVADASHELRTPLASLRTNIEVLAHAERMGNEARERLLADVIAQLDELTVLVGDLVDLARDAELEREPATELRLDLLVAETVELARTRDPLVRIALDTEPCAVRGVAQSLERAVSNLLDNAIKWSPPGAEVEVAVAADGEVRVRDHGPGIDPEDADRVFDRFYRAPSSRGLPGSGLGLAIVRRVAESHGGTVEALAAPGGGALLRLSLPPVAEPAVEYLPSS